MICPYCHGEPDVFDVLLSESSHEIDWLPCCEAGRDLILADLPTHSPQLGCRLRETATGYQGSWNLEVRPISQRDAFEFIAKHHRHHKPPRGWKCGFGVYNGPTLVGVATLGRPVSRVLAGRNWLEVTRLCTAGNPAIRRNAATKLYAACRKAAKKLGADRVCTYTLETEPGDSLTAAGWQRTQKTKGGSWNCQSRPREDTAPTCPKWRWEIGTGRRPSSRKTQRLLFAA